MNDVHVFAIGMVLLTFAIMVATALPPTAKVRTLVRIALSLIWGVGFVAVAYGFYRVATGFGDASGWPYFSAGLLLAIGSSSLYRATT